MPTIKTKEEISVLREGGKLLSKILKEVVKAAKPGVSTLDLDKLAEELIVQFGGSPAFKGYKTKEQKDPYPATLCISINDEVVHSIPSKEKILREGDLVNFDIGMRWPVSSEQESGPSDKKGLFTDMAVTLGIGKISAEAEKLLNTTREALNLGIKAVKEGRYVGDVSSTIQKYLKKNKIGIVRELAGHGVGYAIHEEPLIPNYGRPGTGPELKEGMVLAIEVMTTLGDGKVVMEEDGWGFKSADGTLGGHFEHTIVVTKEGAEVLTI